MLMITQTALELGFLYALVAMALFLSFRILNIADMTTDGCFVFGAAVSVTLAAGGHPILAIPAAMLAGSCAGFVTAFLQTRLGIPSILAGIVTNTGLYTVNLMAMGWKANQSLLGGSTVFTMLRDSGIGGDWYELLLAASVTILAGVLLLAFLKTRMGLSIRATGDNPDMVRASSLNPAFTVTVGLCVSNALTALSGAMVGQYQKTVDINSGTGIVVIGLACLIIGETVLGRRTVTKGVLAVMIGSVIYRYLRRCLLHQGCTGGVSEATDGCHRGSGHCSSQHPKVGGLPAAEAGRWKGRELTCWTFNASPRPSIPAPSMRKRPSRTCLST